MFICSADIAEIDKLSHNVRTVNERGRGMKDYLQLAAFVAFYVLLMAAFDSGAL